MWIVRYFLGSVRIMVTKLVCVGEELVEVGVGGIIRGQLADGALAAVDVGQQQIELR